MDMAHIQNRSSVSLVLLWIWAKFWFSTFEFNESSSELMPKCFWGEELFNREHVKLILTDLTLAIHNVKIRKQNQSVTNVPKGRRQTVAYYHYCAFRIRFLQVTYPSVSKIVPNIHLSFSGCHRQPTSSLAPTTTKSSYSLLHVNRKMQKPIILVMCVWEVGLE